MEGKTKPNDILGHSFKANTSDFSDKIAFDDHKIKFAVKYCAQKTVLDIGCVQHNPENYKSKYWLHKALKEVSNKIIGIDLHKPGIEFLNERGFKVIYADAQQFDLGEKFDVIMAGDIIEHLEDFHGFLNSCQRHMHDESRLLISTPNPWYWRQIVKIATSKEINCNPEHTCWFCLRTLRQLLKRHNFAIGEVVFGSRYLSDRIIPLPKGWKHTSFHVEVYQIR